MRSFSPQQLKMNPQKTALLVIDVQEKLIRVMDGRKWEDMQQNLLNLIHLAKLYHIPLVVTEQYPQGLGPTIDSINEVLEDTPKLDKVEFSACGHEGFADFLAERGVTEEHTIVVTGIEAHICVYQTVLDLLEQGYDVRVPRDAILSRKESDLETGVALMESAGAVITSAETVIFQILQKAGTAAFKAMNKRLTLKKG